MLLRSWLTRTETRLAQTLKLWRQQKKKPAPERNSGAGLLWLPPSSGKVVAIKVHHFVPRSHEVLHKRLLRVLTCVDFRDCPELRVRTEHKVDTRAGPLDFAR